MQAWPARTPNRPILGFWGEQSSQKNVEIPCLGRRRTTVFSAMKFVTVQTNKKQTVNDISTPCLSACVDKNMSVDEKLTNRQLYLSVNAM